MKTVMLVLAVVPVLACAQTSSPENSSVLSGSVAPSLSKLELTQNLAANGNEEAQFRLGLYYDTLEPTAENLQRSAKWYREAAEQGHPLAQYNLGVKFIKGEGVQKSVNRALSLWLQAAQAGHMQAQFNMGRAYYLGIGLQEDLSVAKSWFEKAAAQGDPKSIELLAKLSSLPNKPVSSKPRTVPKAVAPKIVKNEPKSVKHDPSLAKQETKKTSLENTQTQKPLQSKAVESTDDSSAIAVYSGPYQHNHFMYNLSNRQGMKIIEERGENWLKFARQQQLPVWIKKQYLRKTANGKQNYIVNARGVYARAIPSSAKGTVLGFFARNEPVRLLEKQKEWYKVVPSTRFAAWVKRKDWTNL